MDVRAGNIHFQPANLLACVKLPADLNVLFDRKPAHIRHDRLVKNLLEPRKLFCYHRVHARVLQAHGVEHTAGHLCNARLRLGKVVGTVNRADTDGQKLANLMIGKELTDSQYEKIDASGAEVVAELDHVDFNKESKHSGLSDLSLKIHAGEIVGVAGVDGNGQTQLAQLITGVLAPDAGEVHLKGKRVAVFDPNGFIEHGVCHVPEDRNLQGLIGDMSIAENLVLKDADDARFSKGRGLLLKKRAIGDYARRMAEKYDVRCTSVDQSVRSLSGGNQQKVILARELENDPALLVMAHPTRGLDIGATSFVHEQMIGARERGVGILLISADFDEILEMSDRIVVCFEGRIMGEFSGKNPPVEEISLAMTGK